MTAFVDRHGVLLAVLLIAALLMFGRGSWARELAFDDAVLRAHLARSSQP